MIREIKTTGGTAQIVVPWVLEQITEGGVELAVRDVREAFSKMPLIFRCVRIRANTLRRVPVHIFKGNTEVDKWPFHDTMPIKDHTWLSEAALLTQGHTLSIILRNESGIDVGLQWLNPFTVQIRETIGEDGVWHRQAWQYIAGKRFPQGRDSWQEDEIFYMRELNFLSDVGPGTSSSKVALMDSQLGHYVTAFLAQFFKGGAMPVMAITVPEGTQKEEVERIEGFFRRAISGVARAFRAIAVTKSIELKTVTPDLKSFDVKALDIHSVDAIADAFELPTTILRGAAKTKAIADAEMESFIRNTIWHRAEQFEGAYNRLLEPYGYRVVFDIQEMPELQEDENQRAKSASIYQQMGFSLAAACAICGIDVPEEHQDELDISKQKKLKKLTEPQLTTTVTPDGQLTDGQLPAASPLGEQEGAAQPIRQPVNGQFKADMEKWMRKSLTRLGEGQGADVEFNSDYIPLATKRLVSNLLSKATTGEEVKLIFNHLTN